MAIIRTQPVARKRRVIPGRRANVIKGREKRSAAVSSRRVNRGKRSIDMVF